MRNPLVSVIIPVYNGEHYLAEALASIHQQNYKPLEIIVVDDGSTDSSAAIAEADSQVKYFYQNNQGPGVAKNQGILVAMGKYITFLDCDDLWTKNTLNHLVHYLENHPDVDMVNGLIHQYNLDKINGSFNPSGSPYYGPNFGSGLYRTSLFEQVGLFNSEYHAEDTDWLIRACEQDIKKEFYHEITLIRRRHFENITNNFSQSQKGLVYAFYLHLKRSRKNPELTGNYHDLLKYFGYVSVDSADEIFTSP